MEMMELWLALLSVLSGGLGWLVKTASGRLDMLEAKIQRQEVAIEVTRNETQGIRSDIQELKVMLRDINRKLDEYRERDE